MQRVSWLGKAGFFPSVCCWFSQRWMEVHVPMDPARLPHFPSEILFYLGGKNVKKTLLESGLGLLWEV